MQGRIPWMSLVVLLGASPVFAAETILPVSVASPADGRADARPVDVEPAPTPPRASTSIMSLPSPRTIEAVVNGRRLVPGR